MSTADTTVNHVDNLLISLYFVVNDENMDNTISDVK